MLVTLYFESGEHTVRIPVLTESQIRQCFLNQWFKVGDDVELCVAVDFPEKSQQERQEDAMRAALRLMVEPHRDIDSPWLPGGTCKIVRRLFNAVLAFELPKPGELPEKFEGSPVKYRLQKLRDSPTPA